ncbi:MAG: hypothetical protein ACI4SH_08075, partial [Candidatus Scatosoma sp.]
MRIKTKHMLTYGLACGVAAVAVGGVRLLSSGDRVAEAESVTVETADITMVKGASARINSDGHNGLRYSMRVAKEDYEAIKADASYTDVTFGIL